jgi:hypothetical protein
MKNLKQGLSDKPLGPACPGIEVAMDRRVGECLAAALFLL